jgi:hypothetical protein
MINFPPFAKYGQGKSLPNHCFFLKRGLNVTKRNEIINQAVKNP